MSKTSRRIRASRGWVVLAAGAVLLTLSPARAQDGPSGQLSWEPRVPLGKCLSPANTLLYREDPRGGWRPLADQQVVHSRDTILALPGVQGKVQAGPVELTLWGNLPQLSPFPGLQSSVILHDSRAFDLDMTVIRGRVVLTSRKDKGSLNVWLRMEGGAIELSLAEAGDAVAIEAHGRWPYGSSFRRAEEESRPLHSVDFLMLKGQMQVRADRNRYRLTAPPGPAYFHWDSVHGGDDGPLRRDALPPWADPRAGAPREAGLAADAVRQLQHKLADSGLDTALIELLSEARRVRDADRARALRVVAIDGLAAVDDLGPVLDALEGKEPDTRAAAVEALRHWVGQAAGRDQRLDRMLVQRRGFAPGQAETVLQLLRDPFDPESAETYEVLIAYLSHKQQAVRELAVWHLRRLVPEGRKIAYDASAPQAERQRAVAAWEKLIPAGSVPGSKRDK